MSDQTGTIFSGDAPAAPVTEPQTQVAQPSTGEAPAQTPTSADPYADLLGGIKTDDGRLKYATVSDALNSIPHAQGHISTLEAELTEARAELAKRASVEESLQQLANTPQTQEPTAPVGLGEQEVAQLFDARLQQVEIARVSQANQESVANTMKERFGDNAEDTYNAKAAELGVGVDFLNTLAAKSPQLVLEYFGKAKDSAPQPTVGSVNTAAFGSAPQETPKKDVMFGASTQDIMDEWRRCKPNE